MSRHYLAHKTKKKAYFVVGYDRPLKAYYIQVWDNPDDNYPAYEDDCFDLDLLEGAGAVVPEGLRDILVKECLGERDTNACHDWRESDLTDPPGNTQALV